MTLVMRRGGPVREAIKKARRRWRQWRASVHLVSYPKCGRTWLVLLLAEAIQRHYGVHVRNPLKIRRLASPWRGIPYIHPHHDGGPEFRLPEELPADKRFYRNRRVIFLTRDPRDVVVSSYFQKAKRNYNFTGTLDDYLGERRGGLESILAFYNIWRANAHVPRDFLMVTYEDLHADTAGELRRVMDFIGMPGVEASTIDAAVEACRFENMRRLERNNSYNTGALAPRDSNDESTYKTRQGKAGGYREHLTERQMAWIDEVISAQLDPYYECYRYRSVGTR